MCIAAVGVLQFGGCASIIPPIEVDLGLGQTGTLELEDGFAESSGTGTAADIPVSVASGKVQLDPSAISITNPTTTAKGNVAYQLPAELSAACTGEPLVVTVWVAAAELLGTVFDDGEQYGPFEVTLDEGCIPVSVSPSSVTLKSSTIALIEAGSFAIGIRAQSPVDGTLVIDSLSFTLRVSL